MKKKFIFPQNVNSSYGIIAGLSGKDILLYILPALIISLLCAVIPPFTSILLWVIKILIIVVITSTALILALVRPIKDRDNIRLTDFIKQYRDFHKRQKIFYMKKKNKGVKNGTDYQ